MWTRQKNIISVYINIFWFWYCWECQENVLPLVLPNSHSFCWAVLVEWMYMNVHFQHIHRYFHFARVLKWHLTTCQHRLGFEMELKISLTAEITHWITLCTYISFGWLTKFRSSEYHIIPVTVPFQATSYCMLLNT